eukprot:scaffold43448_cov51-Cyclotella_meneghiniana.AAC.3
MALHMKLAHETELPEFKISFHESRKTERRAQSAYIWYHITAIILHFGLGLTCRPGRKPKAKPGRQSKQPQRQLTAVAIRPMKIFSDATI